MDAQRSKDIGGVGCWGSGLAQAGYVVEMRSIGTMYNRALAVRKSWPAPSMIMACKTVDLVLLVDEVTYGSAASGEESQL